MSTATPLPIPAHSLCGAADIMHAIVAPIRSIAEKLVRVKLLMRILSPLLCTT